MKPRRPGLQVKLVVILLVIGLLPVLVSAVLIERISEVAQSFASNEVARLIPQLERSRDAYRVAVKRSKALHQQIAKRIAADPGAAEDPALAEHGLIWVRARSPDGTLLWQTRTGRALQDGEREVGVRESLDAEGGSVLELSFAVDEALSREFQELGAALAQTHRVQTVRGSLPASYRTAFIAVVGGFALLLTAIGVLLGRGVTRRVEELEAGFRAVAAGDLSVRVAVRGSDELAEMSGAFNRMVADLEAERRKSVYLQRIGTWQDVARKLAHEIKNPLTPILLAVQEVESAYTNRLSRDGEPAAEDQRFGRVLGDASEIVREEIDNLRRLVDAFRELGRLPKVAARPLDLQLVMDDLCKDPDIVESLELAPPEDSVQVSADRLLLRRVLHNLVENAVQAGGAPVRVSWREGDDARAEVTVDDSGPGIDHDVRESLFEPYVTSKETGTGLGLAISKKIAIEHGGSLELSDQPSPLGGARFVLTVPLGAEPPPTG